MRVTIHQPNFMPWLGYFDKMRQADVLVLFDTAQFTKNGYQNRTEIKAPNGRQWLTLPVITKGRFGQATRAVEIRSDLNWKRKLLESLRMNYSRAPYFEWFFHDLSRVVEEYPGRMLTELNVTLISLIAQRLGVKTKTVLASEIECEPAADPSEVLLHLCLELGASEYLSGASGRDYLDEELFSSSGIAVVYHDFSGFEYSQVWGGFEERLSSVDLLLNHGSAAAAMVNPPDGAHGLL